MALLPELHHAAQQRSIPAETIVDDYGPLTKEHFDAVSRDRYTPLVIPACNEQQDLPHLLLSAAQSEWPLLPVVVENGSTDDTHKVAKAMGAHTIKLTRASKVQATLEGSLYAHEQLGVSHALYADGDALLPKSWSGFMCRGLAQFTAERGGGGMYIGGIVYAHGQSGLVDAVLSARHMQLRHRAAKKWSRPLVVGANYGLRFDRGGRVLRALATISPDVFLGDDVAMCDAMKEVGVPVAGDASLQSTIVVRGDRLSSIRALAGGRSKRREARLESYRAQYGDDIQMYEPKS